VAEIGEVVGRMKVARRGCGNGLLLLRLMALCGGSREGERTKLSSFTAGGGSVSAAAGGTKPGCGISGAPGKRHI
jgi:hypothetical protein